jgi:hypothetical protein
MKLKLKAIYMGRGNVTEGTILETAMGLEGENTCTLTKT